MKIQKYQAQEVRLDFNHRMFPPGKPRSIGSHLISIRFDVATIPIIRKAPLNQFPNLVFDDFWFGRNVPPPPIAGNVFLKSGNIWLLRYKDCEVFRLRDSKGLRYIAMLLRRKDEDISAGELAELSPKATLGLENSGMGNVDEVLDARAANALRQELERLESIGQKNSPDYLKIQKHLSENTWAGRPRRVSPLYEKIRKAVTNNIANAIKAVALKNKPMGTHLRDSIRTGGCCSYRPATPTTWTI